MKASRSPFTLPFLLLGAMLAGCNGESGGSGGGGGSNGNDGWADHPQIEAILEKGCSGCHGTQFSSCWDVHDSRQSIEGAVASGIMPRGGALAASDKAALLHWLGGGARCSGKRPEGSGGAGGSVGSGPRPIEY